MVVIEFLIPGDGFDIADLAMYAGFVTVILGALALLHRWFLRKPIDRVRRYLDWLDRFREEWEGTPLDPEKPWQPRTPGVLERLNALDGEFADDGNGSLKSSVRRTESLVQKMYEQMQRIEERQEVASRALSEQVDVLATRVEHLERRGTPAA